MCTGAQVRRELVGARRRFRHLWGREATDLVLIRACACRHWRRYRVARARWRLLWEAWSRAIAWIRRGRYTWSRFAECRALADFFQVALDTQHRANIAFSDDHLASPLCSSQSPGHCGNNDPLAFRVAVPYFTYQVKADKKIVTSVVCAR